MNVPAMASQNYDVDLELKVSFIEDSSVLWDRAMETYKYKTLMLEAWREIREIFRPDFASLN